MSADILEKYFGIKSESSIQDGKWTRYAIEDLLYTIVPVSKLEQETLIELYEISEHMAKHGDRKVSVFVAGNEGKYIVTHENEDYVVLKNVFRQRAQRRNVGRMLAIFHERGKDIDIQISSINRMGQWKDYWIKRLEQLEGVWHSIIREKTEEEFDRLFIESFPYYLGLCENAIQYVTDTEMDSDPKFSDMGTVCHTRFHENVWSGPMEIRSPFDWVFDHPGRDIAEWVRDYYFNHTRAFQPEMQKFLQGYQSFMPLSDFSWRLIYARLLFPLHYFSCVEEYYMTNSQGRQKQLEEKLSRYIRDSSEYELFLKHFYEISGVDNEKIPIIDWL